MLLSPHWSPWDTPPPIMLRTKGGPKCLLNSPKHSVAVTKLQFLNKILVPETWDSKREINAKSYIKTDDLVCMIHLSALFLWRKSSISTTSGQVTKRVHRSLPTYLRIFFQPGTFFPWMIDIGNVHPFMALFCGLHKIRMNLDWPRSSMRHTWRWGLLMLRRSRKVRTKFQMPFL